MLTLQMVRIQTLVVLLFAFNSLAFLTDEVMGDRLSVTRLAIATARP
jgi:hypothetical protein